MQTYLIGIGQCGTSIAFDVISNLTGFVQSKAVASSPQTGGSNAASNELLALLNQDLKNQGMWLAQMKTWVGRLWNGPGASRAFIPPRIAIIDGNPDNFVKDAFNNFRGVVQSHDGLNDKDLKQLANLIMATKVLDLDAWKSGCANGIIGERVACKYLSPTHLRTQLGIDGLGNLSNANAPFPVAVFLVVSSGGGATGSGGGVYLGQSDALVDRTLQPGQLRHTLPLNVVVLPSTTASSNNKKYALNAGRALARHGNIIRMEVAGSRGNKPSSTMLFSNPRDEGDPGALQRLNNYIAEFAIRLGNFTFPGNVARIARDLDVRELLRFLSAKASVLAMSHLSSEHWGDPEVESLLVERAFVDMYGKEVDSKKPHGVSVETTVEALEDSGTECVLPATSRAIFMVGMPPKFERAMSLERICACIKKHAGSPLSSGITPYSYGSAKDLELTVLLRYRSMSDCPLAQHFIRQYVGGRWSSQAAEAEETEYLRDRESEDDDYAEAFEEIVADLDELSGTLDLGVYKVRRQKDRWRSASNPENP